MRRGVLGITGLGWITALSLTACGSQPSNPPGGSATAAGTSEAATSTTKAGPASTRATAETANNSPHGGEYHTYTNARFGFSVTLPPSLVGADLKDGNGDGRSFSDPEKAITVSAYGSNNTNNDTAASSAAAFVAQKRADNATITLNDVRGDTYTVSGYVGDMVWYRHMIVESQVEFGLEWTYPASMKDQVDPDVTVSVQSFKPGPNKPA